MEIIRRYELAARLERAVGTPSSAEEKRKLEKEAESCENRRQALVLLLLHYSSGLQSVEEAEQQIQQQQQQQQESKLCDGFSWFLVCVRLCTDGLTRSSIPHFLCPTKQNFKNNKHFKPFHLTITSLFESSVGRMRSDPWPFSVKKTTIPNWAVGNRSILFGTRSRVYTGKRTVRSQTACWNWRMNWHR